MVCIKFKPNFGLKSPFFYFVKLFFKTLFILFSIFNFILFKYYFFIKFLLLERARDEKKKKKRDGIENNKIINDK
jgi:hypothetical protein